MKLEPSTYQKLTLEIKKMEDGDFQVQFII